MSQDTPESPSAEVSEMAQPWPMIEALLGGTTAMREAAQTYLPQHPAESADSYQNRLKQSTLYNAFARTVETMASKPFAEPLKPSEDMPPELFGVVDSQTKKKTKPGWIDNIDLEGRDLQAVAHDGFRRAMAFGPAYILVDYPQLDGVQTLADQRASGARPYFVLIDPKDVLGWRAERINGVQTLTQFRFKECVSEPNGRFAEKRVEQVRVLERTVGADARPARCWWEVWRQNDKNEWFLHAQGPLSIGEIPIAPIYGKRTGFMTADPPLLDLAHLNVEHWQSSSHQSNILRVARVPILFGAGWADGTTMVIGASHAVTSESEKATLQYVEHTGAAIQAGQVSIEKIEERMAVMGMELLVSKPGAKTATEASIDTAENTSSLAAMVQNLEDSLALALSFAAKWANLPTGGSVNLEGNFAALDPLDIASLVKAREKGLISAETFFNELLRLGMVDENLTWEVERQRLAADTSSMVETEGAKAAAVRAPDSPAAAAAQPAGTTTATAPEAPDFGPLLESIGSLVAALGAPPAPPPAHAPMDLAPLVEALKAQPAPVFHVDAPITVNVPEQQPSVVNVTTPPVTVEAAQITVAPPAITVQVQRGGEVEFTTNADGDITGAKLN